MSHRNTEAKPDIISQPPLGWPGTEGILYVGCQVRCFLSQVTVLLRISIVVSVLLLTSGSASADFRPISLIDLATNSDVIAGGTIREVRDETFVLEVRDPIHGTVKGRRLTIYRFRNWVCAWREPEYAVGQHVLVFLVGGDDGTPYGIRGAGNEGERLIVEKRVHLLSEPSSYETARSAIIDFRRAYQLKRTKPHFRTDGKTITSIEFESVTQLISNDQIERIRSKSPCHKYMIDTARLAAKNLTTHRRRVKNDLSDFRSQ